LVEEGGKAVNLESERVGMAGNPEAIGVCSLQGFEEKPLVLDSPCAHAGEPDYFFQN
jgi:hypothetical protein